MLLIYASIEPTDAVVTVTRACICGSDLWPYQKMEQRVLCTSTIPLSQLPKNRGATYRTPPPSCVSQCNLPANDDMVNLATELAAPAWLALRNPSSAKRKCRRIRNTLILGLVYPSKTTRLDGDLGC